MLSIWLKRTRDRGEVESTRLEAKDTKNIRGQRQPFRGQTFARARTQAQVFSKKIIIIIIRSSKKIFFMCSQARRQRGDRGSDVPPIFVFAPLIFFLPPTVFFWEEEVAFFGRKKR